MRPRWFVSVLFLSSMVPAAWAMSPAEQFETRMQAEQAFNQSDYATAATLYEKLLPLQPQNGELLYELAMAQFRSGNLEGARAHMLPALDLGHGRKANIYFAIAQSAAREGNPGPALDFLKMAFAQRMENAAKLLDDEAFASMRDHPDFKRLVGVAPDGLDRKAGWAHDLDYFKQEVRRLHVDKDGYAFSADLETDIAALKARVSELSDEEVAIELQRMIVKLGDGHSSIWGVPGERVRFPSLPIKLYFFSDGLFVTDASEQYRHLIGAQVMAIGERSSEHLLADLTPYCSRDNGQGALSTAASYARRTAMLKVLGYSASADQATVTFLTAAGETHKVTMAPERHQFPRGFGPVGGELTEQTPTWLRKTDQNYWHQEMPDLSTLYVQFNSVQNSEDGPSISEYAGELRKVLASGNFRELVVDVRHNGGGNNFLIWPMIRVLTAHADASPDHRVWIATSRGTFSACQNFVNFADRIIDPIFIGEPSGSKPNFIGETSQVKLLWSGVRMSISSRYWQDSFPNDDREYIPMHLPVPLSSTDYFGNVDPVMVALKEVLTNGSGTGSAAAEE